MHVKYLVTKAEIQKFSWDKISKSKDKPARGINCNIISCKAWRTM